MSDKYRMELRVCESCGGEYVGGKKSHLCKDCRRRKQAAANRDYQAKRRAGGGRAARPAGGGAHCAPLQETGGQIARATGPMASHAAGNGTQGGGVIRVCVDCGAAFAGTPASKRCPECKAALEDRKAEDAGRETANEKTGWRNMFRDATGTVIVPGGNVMRALDDLCAYEEACEALGVQGPQQLQNLLTHVATLMPAEVILRCAREGRRPEPRKREASSAVRVEYGCRCCGSCGHFVPERESGKGTAGHCDCHPKKIRSGGGKKGKLVEVPGEYRKCFGAREACRDWTARETAPNAGRDATSSGPSGHLPLKGKALDERGGAGGSPELRGSGRQSAVPTGGADGGSKDPSTAAGGSPPLGGGGFAEGGELDAG